METFEVHPYSYNQFKDYFVIRGCLGQKINVDNGGLHKHCSVR
jgi:hypothetical protein